MPSPQIVGCWSGSAPAGIVPGTCTAGVFTPTSGSCIGVGISGTFSGTTCTPYPTTMATLATTASSAATTVATYLTTAATTAATTVARATTTAFSAATTLLTSNSPTPGATGATTHQHEEDTSWQTIVPIVVVAGVAVAAAATIGYCAYRKIRGDARERALVAPEGGANGENSHRPTSQILSVPTNVVIDLEGHTNNEDDDVPFEDANGDLIPTPSPTVKSPPPAPSRAGYDSRMASRQAVVTDTNAVSEAPVQSGVSTSPYPIAPTAVVQFQDIATKTDTPALRNWGTQIAATRNWVSVKLMDGDQTVVVSPKPLSPSPVKEGLI